MKYSQEQLIEAIKNSTSIRQVLNKLNLKEAGGNYKTIHRKIKKLLLDTSHFLGQAANFGKKFGSRRPLKDYLSNKHTIGSYKLKNRLLKEKIFERCCSICNLSTWLDNPIPIELDHINGNPENNNLSNLRLLCPNCHATTVNYPGKNKKPYQPPIASKP